MTCKVTDEDGDVRDDDKVGVQGDEVQGDDMQGDGLHGGDGVKGGVRDDEVGVQGDDMQGDGLHGGDGVRDDDEVGVQGDDQRGDDEVQGDDMQGDGLHDGDGVKGGVQEYEMQDKDGDVQDDDEVGVQGGEDDNVQGGDDDHDVHGAEDDRDGLGDVTDEVGGVHDMKDPRESQDCRSTMAVHLKEKYKTVERKDKVLPRFKQWDINNKHTGVLGMVRLFEQISSGMELNTSSSTSIREEMEFGLGGLKEKFRKRNTRGYHLRESAEEETNFV